MELTLEQVKHIASLARIELKSEEEESFQRQLSSILEYVGQLSECDTEGVLPMSHAVSLVNALRPDEISECSKETRNRLYRKYISRRRVDRARNLGTLGD